MGNRKNRKSSSAKTRQFRRNKTYTPSDHLDKENDPSKVKQHDAPDFSKFSGTNSKQLSSQPRKVLLPTPPSAWNVPYTNAKTSHIIQFNGIQNDQIVNCIPTFRQLTVTFGEKPSPVNFRNPLRYDFTLPSFNFGSTFAANMPPRIRSVAFVAPNNSISKNSTLKQPSGRDTLIFKHGYYLTRRNAEKYQSGNLMASQGSAASLPSIYKENQNVEDDSDDVMYLYSVDTTPNGRIVEEVDLLNESVTVDLTAKRSTKETVILTQVKEVSNAPAQTSKTVFPSSSSTGANQTSIKQKSSRKRKMSENKENPNKRANKEPFQPKCCICDVQYKELTKINEYMSIATGCGHLFCRPCICKSKKNCDICGIKILSYRKVFL